MTQHAGTNPCPAAEPTQGRFLSVGDTKPHEKLSLQLAVDGKSCRCIHHTATHSQHTEDCHLMHKQVNGILEHIYTVLLDFHLFVLFVFFFC